MGGCREMRIKDGTVAAEIIAAFSVAQLGEVECRRFLAGIVRPAIVCPVCGVSSTAREIERLIDGRNIVCKACGRKHGLFAGTVLCGLNMDARAVVLACVMRKWGCSLTEIAKAAGIYPSTVSRLFDRLSMPMAFDQARGTDMTSMSDDVKACA